MSNIGNKEIFAKNLSYYVTRCGRDQKEIAEVVGVAPSTFNEWVKGKKFPRIDKIQKLADYFGILKSDLIEDKSEQEKPVTNDGLSENHRKLIDFAEQLSEDQAEKVLRLMQSILAFDE